MHRIVPSALVLALVCAACASPAHKKAAAPVAKAPAASASAVAAAKPAGAPAPAAVTAPALPSGKLAKAAMIVASVDPAAGTVSLKHHGVTKVYRVAQGAKLNKGGDDASIGLGNVTAGDHVSVAYAGDVLASLHVKVMAAASSGKVAASK